MATEFSFYTEENSDGLLVQKPFLVTIALEEYRSLVKENIQKDERILWLESELDRLNAPKGCVDNGNL